MALLKKKIEMKKKKNNKSKKLKQKATYQELEKTVGDMQRRLLLKIY